MKVSVIGTGHVGATVAFTLVVRGLCDEIVLVNRTHRKAEGEAADLQHACAFATRAMTIRAGEIQDTAGSDIVIMTAAAPTSGGIPSRTATASENAKLIDSWVPQLTGLSPDCILLIVTNPVDAMTYRAWQVSGLPAERVIGSGTLIDSARFRSYLSQHLHIHPDDIRAYVLGEHGDTQFAALSVAATGGERIDHDPALSQLFDRTVASAHEIFAIKGYTNYAIALAVAMIVESILLDNRRTLPVSTLLDGYEEQSHVCLSIPAVIGRSGIVRRLMPQLSAEESSAFRKCGEAVRQIIRSLPPVPSTIHR
ncbi:MAG: lactate dehydrogenase [Pirellulales bacterium]